MNWFKKSLKTFFYSLLKIFPAKGAVVLMYHSVGENSEFFTVSLADFEKQMCYLSENNFNVIPTSSLVEMLENGRAIPPKTVVITFDDGYEDNYRQAWPILKKYNLPATIFVITGSVGGMRELRNGHRLKMMKWEEMTEMRREGLVEFYPHSQNHKKFPTLSSRDITAEIEISTTAIREHLSVPADIFAFPFGSYSQTAVEAVKKCDIKAAFTIETGMVKIGDNPYKLKRNSIDSKVTFAMFKGIVKRGRI